MKKMRKTVRKLTRKTATSTSKVASTASRKTRRQKKVEDLLDSLSGFADPQATNSSNPPASVNYIVGLDKAGEAGPSGQVWQVSCLAARRSEFKEVDPSDTAKLSAPAIAPRGILEHTRKVLSLFEASIDCFESWRGRLVTGQYTYDLGNPKRITRDIRPDGASLTLHFGRLTAVKEANLKSLAVFDRFGNALAGKCMGYAMKPDDVVSCDYSIRLKV